MKKYIDIFNTEFLTPGLSGIRGLDPRHPIRTTKKIYTHFMSDSLYRNSIYLMASTFIMAFFGFFFWIINARLYTPEQVGIATTLISVMTLIASFSNLGLNVGLVRFLPNSDHKNELINSSFVLSSITAFVLSVGFLAGLHIFSPSLLFVRDNPIYALSFVLFVVALSNNTIAESLFVAYRSAKYTLIKNSVLSITKLALPVALIAFGAYGIFTAVGLANFIALVLSILILMRMFKYSIRLKQNFTEIKKIASYSFGNYIAGFIGGLPTMILPIIIVNELGPAEAGYFYIAMMIANLLFIIPQAITRSMFAEGSYGQLENKKLLRKALKLISIILIPMVVIFMLFGEYILLPFGKVYSSEAFMLLNILLASSIFVSLNYVFGTILNLKNKVNILLFQNLFFTIMLFIVSGILIDYKLTGIGISYLIASLASSFMYIYAIWRLK